MAKSEFDKQLPIQDGRVKVSGVLGLDRDKEGVAITPEEPVVVHWVLEQGRLVTHGQTEAREERFTNEDATAQPWKAGAARVSGVAVTVTERPVASIETFTWSQEVELTLP